MSDNARHLLRLAALLDRTMTHPQRCDDTYTLECRVREAAAALIGWMA